MKLNLQFFGGRGSAGGNAKESAVKAAASIRNTAQNAERIREKGETEVTTRREVAEAAKGERSWKPTENEVHRDVSYARAEKQYFNAPIGTTITMESRDGDYIGEYTRTTDGWKGRQRYKSSYAKPADVKTAKGFATAITGRDIKVTTTAERINEVMRQSDQRSKELERKRERERLEISRNMTRKR